MKLRTRKQILLFTIVLSLGWNSEAQSPDALERARLAAAQAAAQPAMNCPGSPGCPGYDPSQSPAENGGLFGECDPDRSTLETAPKIIELKTTLMTKFPHLKAQLESHFKNYESNYESCASRSNVALTACMVCLSSNIQNGVNIAQTALTALSGVSATTGQCGGIQDAAKGIQLALGAYQAACGAAKALCDLSCGKTSSGLTHLEKVLPTVKTQLVAQSEKACLNDPNGVPISSKDFQTTISSCTLLKTEVSAIGTKIDNIIPILHRENTATEPGAIAKKTKTCQGYAMTMLSAASGIGSFALLNQQSAACKKETQASQAPQDKCAPLPGKTIIETTLDNTCLASLCGKTEYTNRAECVCYTNPRTPGCNNGLTPAGQDTVGGLQATNVDPNANRLQSPGGTTASSSEGGSGTVSTRSSLGSGGLKSVDSSSGLSGAGAGSGLNVSSGISKEVAPSAVSRPSTSLFGGESSGSGGYSPSYGGSGGGGGALRSYLPGGKKDPLRANASVGAEGVTSAGGKSNFEKITDRYVENRSTLSVTGR